MLLLLICLQKQEENLPLNETLILLDRGSHDHAPPRFPKPARELAKGLRQFELEAFRERMEGKGSPDWLWEARHFRVHVSPQGPGALLFNVK